MSDTQTDGAKYRTDRTELTDGDLRLYAEAGAYILERYDGEEFETIGEYREREEAVMHAKSERRAYDSLRFGGIDEDDMHPPDALGRLPAELDTVTKTKIAHMADELDLGGYQLHVENVAPHGTENNRYRLRVSPTDATWISDISQALETDEFEAYIRGMWEAMSGKIATKTRD